MGKSTIPVKATILGLVMGGSGLWIGLAAGAWVMPLVIATYLHHDLTILTKMPSRYLLPSLPIWYTPREHTLWNIGALIGIAGAGVGMYFAEKLWRHVVVTRYKWTTNKEVDDFLKRAGDSPE